ncbi:MAG: hydrogenase maturation protease [Steroidobacteraceae bacterium]
MIGSIGPGVAPRKVLVIGIGNPDRGDDAVGAIVAQELCGRLPADVPILFGRGDMLGLIEEWTGFDGLVCVDAAAPLGKPGRIHRIDLRTRALPRDLHLTSSHVFGLAEVIQLARTLNLAPRQIIVYAVESGSFDSGMPLTSAVAAAARAVADRIVVDVGRLR